MNKNVTQIFKLWRSCFHVMKSLLYLFINLPVIVSGKVVFELFIRLWNEIIIYSGIKANHSVFISQV